jgi:hypothetical protein
MIWALLYLYFFGGASVDLSIMNIAKPVKQYVLDEVKAKEMDVTVKLWYLPAGGDHRDDKAVEVNKGKYLFFETTKTVTIK